MNRPETMIAGGALRSARARQAYALLLLTAVMWAGNSIAARLAVGEISPLLLTFLRWGVACATLAVIAGRQVREEWRLLVPAWKLVVLMGSFGYTAFNALYYTAGAYTTAVNLTVIQSSMPAIVLIGGLIIYGTPVRALQVVGVVVTLVGVGFATTHGDLDVIRNLDFNRGDVFVFIACVLYAGYTLAIPKRPKVSGLVFFTAMAAAACLTSVPLAVGEALAGRTIWPSTLLGFSVLLFVAWGPTLVAQVSFLRAVELIGPGRAGVFMNCVPVFAAFMAVAFLGEPYRITDALALALVLGGIYIAERLPGGRR
jgi:drug/metabolite transporter (DMT)-like permease